MTRMQLGHAEANHHFCTNLVAQLFSDHHKSPKLNRPHHFVWRHQLYFSETSCACSWQHHKEPSDSCYIIHNWSSLSESGWGTALSRGLLLLKEVGRVGDRDPTSICLHLGSFSSSFSTFFLHKPARNLYNSHWNQCYARVLNANLRAEFKSVCRIPRAPKAINAENKFNLTWKKGLNIYAPNISSSLHSSVPFIAELFSSTESHPFELGHSLFRKYN